MKQPPLIKSTKDYDLFVSHENQQPMSELHVRRIADSMKKHGFLPSKPVQVYKRPDGTFGVIDGHHRLAAAMKLGMYVLFLVEPKAHADLIGEENVLVRKWSSLSFVNLYADRGNNHYSVLQDYIKSGFPLTIACSLLAGESAHSGNQSARVRDGSFRVKTTRTIEIIKNFIEKFPAIAPLRTRPYMEAVSQLLFVKEFDISILIKRINANPTMIRPVATRHQALEEFEEIYNLRSREKLPLRHLAEKKMRERSAANLA